MHLVICLLGGVLLATLVCWRWVRQPSQVCDPQNLTQLFRDPSRCHSAVALSVSPGPGLFQVDPWPSAVTKIHRTCQGCCPGPLGCSPPGPPRPTSAAGRTSRECSCGCSREPSHWATAVSFPPYPGLEAPVGCQRPRSALRCQVMNSETGLGRQGGEGSRGCGFAATASCLDALPGTSDI